MPSLTEPDSEQLGVECSEQGLVRQDWLQTALAKHHEKLIKDISAQLEGFLARMEHPLSGLLEEDGNSSPSAWDLRSPLNICEAFTVHMQTEHGARKELLLQQSPVHLRSETRLMRENIHSIILKKASPADKRFDYLVSFVIMLHIVTMIGEMEWQATESIRTLHGERPLGDVGFYFIFFAIMEHVYNAFFVLEGIIRFYYERCSYFFNPLNWLDFALVVFSSIQLYILRPAGLDVGGTLTIFRVFRVARFVRVLKVMKLDVFTDLRVLVSACISSMAALFWSMVLLFILMFTSALLMCNLLTGIIQDPNMDYTLRHWLYRHYGNTFRSVYTLFEVTLAGCWPQYFRPLIEDVSTWYALFAMLYITIVVFAVIRIITAIFLQQTLTAARADSDTQVSEMRSKTRNNAEKLTLVFEAIDTDKDGMLTFDEFARAISEPDVVGLLSTMELAVHDVQGLFDLLDGGDGMITYKEFIDGVLRLRGQARSLDVVAVCRSCDKIEKLLQVIDQRINEIKWPLHKLSNVSRQKTGVSLAPPPTPLSDNGQSAKSCVSAQSDHAPF